MSANSSGIVESIGYASAPIATIAVAFFTYLSSKSNKRDQQIKDKDIKIKELEENNKKSQKECQKEVDDLKEKLDEADAREDIMLRYIYGMRRRDYEQGREPLPLPEELSLRS